MNNMYRTGYLINCKCHSCGKKNKIDLRELDKRYDKFSYIVELVPFEYDCAFCDSPNDEGGNYIINFADN